MTYWHIRMHTDLNLICRDYCIITAWVAGLEANGGDMTAQNDFHILVLVASTVLQVSVYVTLVGFSDTKIF